MIVYTPIDIKWTPPSYSEIKKYFLENYMTNLTETTGYTSQVCALALPGQVTNWRDAKEVFAIDEPNDNQTLYYAEGVTDRFPEIFELIKQLPFKKVIGAMLNMHTQDLAAHRDFHLGNENMPSPERYNVLLSPHYEQPSFFVSKEEHGKKYYPTVLKDYPVYAFNNNDIYHGADIVLDDRIILVCAGFLDAEKHTELINRSADKFKEYVIRF
jgi:hypothetical protein